MTELQAKPGLALGGRTRDEQDKFDTFTPGTPWQLFKFLCLLAIVVTLAWYINTLNNELDFSEFNQDSSERTPADTGTAPTLSPINP